MKYLGLGMVTIAGAIVGFDWWHLFAVILACLGSYVYLEIGGKP